MSIYLTRAHYSQEAFKGMISQPADRESAAKAMFDAAGIKLHHMWYSGNGEVICVVEGDAVSGATAGMVVMASGGFTNVESIELVTMAQMVDSMKSAGAIAAKFRPPGK
ncbi:GYD domain-containing protein [Halopseudomonas sp.]|uniref:GYD domain-containing protein n=1 Tax=Halopseudomonas sp. TaxID=2901191 RepID=UPI0035687E92